MAKLVYLASPYSGTTEQREKRLFQTKQFVVSRLDRKDEIIYSPILHSYHIATEFNLPHEFEFWKWRDLEMIKRCDEMLILHLDGWEQSIGVQEELKFARENNITIRHCWLPLDIKQ